MDNDNIIYNFKLYNSNHQLINFSDFKGKVVLIVNVASLCGFTPQYDQLQHLYSKYHNRGLEILAFPCNQFGNQEPLTDKQIEQSVRQKFNVTFPIMKKINVNGDHEEQFYTHLKSAKSGPLGFKGLRWNFEKFIIDKQGNVVQRFNSMITPLQFEQYIEDLLNE